VELVLEIADLKHLEKVTRSLSSMDGVLRVDRKYNIRHARCECGPSTTCAERRLQCKGFAR
jgi:hypothetical protein